MMIPITEENINRLNFKLRTLPENIRSLIFMKIFKNFAYGCYSILYPNIYTNSNMINPENLNNDTLNLIANNFDSDCNLSVLEIRNQILIEKLHNSIFKMKNQNDNLLETFKNSSINNIYLIWSLFNLLEKICLDNQFPIYLKFIKYNLPTKRPFNIYKNSYNSYTIMLYEELINFNFIDFFINKIEIKNTEEYKYEFKINSHINDIIELHRDDITR